MDSLGIIEKRGRGKNSMYRLTQSMFDQNENKNDFSAAGGGVAMRRKTLNEGLSPSEEETRIEVIDISSDGENNTCNYNQLNQTEIEIRTHSSLQFVKKDAAMSSNKDVLKYSQREEECIIEV